MRKTSYIICDKCHDLIGAYGFKKHYLKCTGVSKNLRKPPRFILGRDFRSITKNKFECMICLKTFTTKGIHSHLWSQHTPEGNRHDSNKDLRQGTRQIWNKGLTKNINQSVLKLSLALKKHTKETNEKMRLNAIKQSERMKELHKTSPRKFGGYTIKGGRGKKFHVKDSFGKDTTLQSSYEYRCFQLLEKLQIKWIRPTFFVYDSKKKYFPDFYLVDLDIYLDPKNSYLITIDTEKIEKVKQQHGINILILTEGDLVEEKFKTILKCNTNYD